MEKREIKEIIEEANKYHYVGCGTKKCKFLVSSNDKTYAKNKTLELLSPDWEKLIDTVIYRVTIRNAVKGDWDSEENEFISGPIYMEITEYLIKPKNKLKIKSSGINRQVYFSEKYLKKNKKIKKDDITNSVFKYEKRELKKGLMEENIL